MTDYERGYKDGMADAALLNIALPNLIDNGDKLDGYAYSYKTDSEGVPYINIDSVRTMLTKATNAQPCTLCGNNCQVSLSEQFKVRNELCKEREENIIPTEVKGLYLNIPVEEDYQKAMEGLRKYAKSSPNLLGKEEEEE